MVVLGPNYLFLSSDVAVEVSFDPQAECAMNVMRIAKRPDNMQMLSNPSSSNTLCGPCNRCSRSIYSTREQPERKSTSGGYKAKARKREDEIKPRRPAVPG